MLTMAVLGGLLITGDRALSQNWAATSSPINGWISVASSADGTKLVAAGDVIYVSTDSGASWTPANAVG